MTLKKVYNEVFSAFKATGYEHPMPYVNSFLSYLIGYRIEDTIIHPDRVLTDDQIHKVISGIEKIKNGVPVEYITNVSEFNALELFVGDGVLIPREDTTTLVDTVLSFMKGKNNCKVLDLCSGSGCISISLALANKDVSIDALEKSQKAFEYLSKNVAKYKCDNINLIHNDLFDFNPMTNFYDVIVCNPPYIRSEDIPFLEAQVQYEPHMALDGGEDGLKFYRYIADAYFCAIKDKGMLAFEVGYDQAEMVLEILRSAGYNDLCAEKDYSGIVRVVYGFK